jgi:hypothetical protein
MGVEPTEDIINAPDGLPEYIRRVGNKSSI